MATPGFAPSVSLAPECAVEDSYTRQRGTLESEPGLHVPFWLLIPACAGPWPLALTPHGHTHHGADQYAGLPRSPEDARKIARKRKDLAVQAVRRGYACIAPATRSTSASPVRSGESGSPRPIVVASPTSPSIGPAMPIEIRRATRTLSPIRAISIATAR